MWKQLGIWLLRNVVQDLVQEIVRNADEERQRQAAAMAAGKSQAKAIR